MSFRKKAILLSAIVAALAIANILSFVFDPSKPRASSFAWLDPSLLIAADYIEIHGRGSFDDMYDETPVVLVRRNNRWLYRMDSSGQQGTLLPVKQARVDDFLAALSRKAIYPKRAFSSEARAALALEEGRASRILVRGGSGLPLLDLLIGTADVLGRDVYFRNTGKSDIYSGEDFFTLYTESRKEAWFDLRLFPGETGAITVDSIQQAELRFFGDNSEPQSFILRRQSRNEARGGWGIPGEATEIDGLRVESWLRSVLEAEGEDFGFNAPVIPEKSIILRLGDGSMRTIQAGRADENSSTSVAVSGSAFMYMLPEWTVNRLFREKSYFAAR